MIGARIEKLRSLMAGEGLDGLLLCSCANQSYITGADFHDGYVVVNERGCFAVVDFRYLEAVKNCAADGVEVVLAEDGTLKRAIELLTCNGAKRVACEGEEISHADFERAQALLGDFAELSGGAGKLLLSMRAVKSPEEIKKTEAAQSITDRAFSHIISVMTPNMTEREVALELEYFMRKQGADKMAFDVIAVSGSASALPHGVPRNVRLERGFLIMDFGAMVDGYCSDMTRTVVIGKADGEMKRLYNTVLLAQQTALDALEAGLSCAKADKIARDIINGAGYEGCFGHSLGHGVGKYIHEAPNLSSRSEAVLEVGNVVTVEPGIYIEGKYGCRIEDMVAVTNNGIYNFTKSKKELIELF